MRSIIWKLVVPIYALVVPIYALVVTKYALVVTQYAQYHHSRTLEPILYIFRHVAAEAEPSVRFANRYAAALAADDVPTVTAMVPPNKERKCFAASLDLIIY